MKKAWLKLFFLAAIVPALAVLPACDDDDDDDGGGTDASGLSAPAQTSPANGAVYNNFPRTITLAWAPVADADSYIVDVDYEGGGWNDMFTTEVTGTAHTFDFIGMQAGRWRVRAKKADGTEGPWSSFRTFEFTI